MELNLVFFIQSMFCPFTEWFFKTITLLGEEGFFLLFFIGMYWLFNKRFAFNFATIYFSGMALNGIVKVLVKRPRPYLASDQVLNLKQETSYSFPSGHSQAFATISMMSILAAKQKNKLVKTTAISTSFLLVLVIISRMFLGQHYLTDCLVGACMGLIIAYFGSLSLSHLKKTDFVCIFISIISGLSIFIFTPHMLEFGGNYLEFFKFSALISGGYLAYFLEEKFINFRIEKTTNLQKVFISLIGFTTAIALYIIIDKLVKMNLLVFICFFALALLLMNLLPFIFKKLFNKGDRIENGRI